ncbi:MAG: LysR family transcriptional regulator [Rikenellaceae bacterium]
MLSDFRFNVFVTVARTLSFTKAAAMLNVSQPAISKHIKELESEFGEPLFNRHGNRISLTQKAMEILPLVESIIEGYGALNETICSDRGSFEGVLHIGASTTIAQYVLPEVLAKFNRAYPRIRVSVISANSDDVIELLQQRRVDIALIEGDNINSTIHYSVFASDKIVLLSSKRRERSLALDKVEQLPLLIREEGSGTLSVITNALKSRGLDRRHLNIKLQLGSSEAIIRYLKASDAYAFVSILVARDHLERGELSICEVEGFEISRKFRFATLHGQNGRLISLFESLCESHCSKLL